MDKRELMEKILELYMEQKSNYWIFFGWNDDSDDNNDPYAADAAHAALPITYDIFFYNKLNEIKYYLKQIFIKE